tara:strand:- start:19157 stop:19378 length:222 start_codon:yes stop_codon:yes gene_type:complete
LVIALVTECPECNKKFFKRDIENKELREFCECGNIEITNEKVKNNRYNYNLRVGYIRSRPKIYEIDTETGETP